MDVKSFFKKPTEADKLMEEIKSLQLRKETVVSVIENEKGQLMQRKADILYQMGVYVYESSKQEGVVLSFQMFLADIAQLEAEIVLKDEKINSMRARYDEEIVILETKVAMLQPAPMANVGESKNFCAACGRPAGAEDIFCEGCGTKIQG